MRGFIQTVGLAALLACAVSWLPITGGASLARAQTSFPDATVDLDSFGQAVVGAVSDALKDFACAAPGVAFSPGVLKACTVQVSSAAEIQAILDTPAKVLGPADVVICVKPIYDRGSGALFFRQNYLGRIYIQPEQPTMYRPNLGIIDVAASSNFSIIGLPTGWNFIRSSSGHIQNVSYLPASF